VHTLYNVQLYIQIGWTPLLAASSEGYANIVKELLQHQVQLEIENHVSQQKLLHSRVYQHVSLGCFPFNCASRNMLLCTSYVTYLSWSSLMDCLAGGPALATLLLPWPMSSYSWQAASCTCPWQLFLLMHPLGGTLSPLVGSTGPGPDHVRDCMWAELLAWLLLHVALNCCIGKLCAKTYSH
jgi:hypothetical protein